MEPRIHAGLNIRRWRPRLAPSRPRQTDHVPAALEMVARGENFADREWEPSHGAMIVPRQPEPAPASSEPFSIPPPPWQSALEAGDLDVAALADTPEPAAELTALDELKLRDRTDDDWPAAPGPPMVNPPLQQPKVPSVDWRAEERERAEQETQP